MRRLLLIPLLLLTGCPSQPDEPGDESLWKAVELMSKPLDVPHVAVSIAEVGRHEPPDGINWPASPGFERQTVWMWRNDAPVLMAATAGGLSVGEDGEALWREHATAHMWDWGTGSAETYVLDPQPPELVNQPIPFPGDDESPVKYALVGTGGKSSTRSLRIGERDPVSAPIVDGIWLYNSDGSLDDWVEIDTVTHELDPHDRVPTLEGLLAGSLVIMETRIEWVPLPNSATQIPVASWARIDLQSRTVERLDRMTEPIEGARVDTYLDGLDWFFLSGPGDIALVDSLLNGAIAFDPFQRPDLPEVSPKRLRFTGRPPPVHWNGSHIVFCDQTSNESDQDQSYLVALQLHGDSLQQSEPTIIWQSGVPRIFEVSIAIPVGPDRRPYIVCLDPSNGDLTVFDPLLGAIRYQTTIDLAPRLPGLGLPDFCVSLEPDPLRPTVLIHDPNANEFIEIELSAREAGEGGGIAPVTQTLRH